MLEVTKLREAVVHDEAPDGPIEVAQTITVVDVTHELFQLALGGYTTRTLGLFREIGKADLFVVLLCL